MALEIYNTLTRRKEPFQPIDPPTVRMYVCGVTVYDFSHMGHARAYVVFDTVYRWLAVKGFEVNYVRNFTDVDDKILKRAADRGVPAEAVSEQFIEAFHEDMAKLGLLAPTIEPKATEHVPEMIEIISRLVDRGIAYVSGGDVWYSVSAWPEYGKLSRRKLEDMRAGAGLADRARTAVDPAELKKRDPADFALWKAAKPGERSWDSPWGKGRPGWHIECSAMSRKYLGQPFDLHGGGEDLVFPHHENEIAQSEAAYGARLSNVWLHNAFLNVNAEKMSKSLGNFTTVRDVLGHFDGEAIRLFVLSAHYRSPLDFTDGAMVEATGRLERLYDALAKVNERTRTHPEHTLEIGDAKGPEADEARALIEGMNARFTAAMDDDFNTASALSVLFEVARAMNRFTQRPAVSSGEHEVLVKLRHGMRELAGHLGLLGADPARWLETNRHAGLKDSGLTPAEIDAKIAERLAARKSKDFRKADEVRDWLKERGVLLEDNPTGTTWRRA
jgi:cysteinyl-tRNA synthetase